MAGFSAAETANTQETARLPRWGLIALAAAAALVLLGGGGYVAITAFGGSSPTDETTDPENVAKTTRGPLLVTVTENGELEAENTTDIKCQVEGTSTIIELIDEGSRVEEGDKLLALDPSDLKDKLTDAEGRLNRAKAALEQARQSLKIQQSTRQSQLSEANLAVKFAVLDLRKYLGSTLADRLAKKAPEGTIDFVALAEDADLGGAARQEKRRLASEIDLAEEELSRAEGKAEWTARLEAKGYVTRSELEADRLAVKRKEVEMEQARTALELFLAYEFPKLAEQYCTDWREAGREAERVEARTQSELASAQADLQEKQDTFDQERRNVEKVRTQLENTVIRAPQSGMVVYARDRRGRSDSNIELGGTVRYQQTLFQLPDLSQMKAEVEIMDSVVKSVKLGAPATVKIEGWNAVLGGAVSHIDVMPARGAWWSNSDVKKYPTDVSLDRTPDGLKPGLSAEVTITVADLDDALKVPVPAVHIQKGYHVVFVRTKAGTETRRVKIGLANDASAQILDGLTEGETVYLYRPEGAPELKVEDAKPRRPTDGETPTAADSPGQRAAEDTAKTDSSKPSGMSAERMKALREEYENASPEEREQMREKMRKAMEKRKKAGNATGGQP